MEVKFNQKVLQCLRPVFSQVHSGEQTQELRLPEGLPDIGRILGCWGQVLMRGKEWRTGMISANGGVMVWILYAPEDGTQPRVVDTWMPFQAHWDLPENEDDGTIHLKPVLTELDARNVSARKLMIRASIDTFAAAMIRHQAEIAVPSQMPEDVQILQRTYPMELPVEAGEKQVILDENFVLPGGMPPVHKLIRYCVKPTVQEQKVLGNRLVFRGSGKVDITYMTEDGSINSWQTDFPFSQFTELDRDYSPHAAAWVSPLLTAMEMEVVEGQMKLHGGLAAQYMIFDRYELEFVEDAFSPVRNMEVRVEPVTLPILLDRSGLELPFESEMKSDGVSICCTDVLTAYPDISNDDGNLLRMQGKVAAMTTHAEGQMYEETARFYAEIPLASDGENKHILWLGDGEELMAAPKGDGFRISGNFPIHVHTYSGRPITMVTELELGERKESDRNRPSVILRRAGEEGLWGLAKKCGSTVDAIREVNKLKDEPEIGKLLLIPVN